MKRYLVLVLLAVILLSGCEIGSPSGELTIVSWDQLFADGYHWAVRISYELSVTGGAQVDGSELQFGVSATDGTIYYSEVRVSELQGTMTGDTYFGTASVDTFSKKAESAWGTIVRLQ